MILTMDKFIKFICKKLRLDNADAADTEKASVCVNKAQ